jgi:hypothetical protein
VVHRRIDCHCGHCHCAVPRIAVVCNLGIEIQSALGGRECLRSLTPRGAAFFHWGIMSKKCSEIVTEYLESHGYDGLCNNECGCGIGEIGLCGHIEVDCVPAYRYTCNGCPAKCEEFELGGYCFRDKRPSIRKW